MKTLLALASAMLISTIVSCNSGSEKEAKIEELVIQNNRLRDSLNQLTTLSNLVNFPNSLEIDTTSGLFGKLTLDTLVLFAEYADCGEWGGHHEWLKIYIQDKITKAMYIRDSVACRYNNMGRKYFPIEKTTFILRKSLQQEVIYYLLDLNRMSFLDMEMNTNSANSYAAFIKDGSRLPLQTRYQVSLLDPSFSWNHFEMLIKK